MQTDCGRHSVGSILVAEANWLLGDKDAAIGPSYFMVSDGALTVERIERIWKHSVIPYLQERLIGEPGRLEKEFALGVLRTAAAKRAGEEPQEDEREEIETEAA